jgi:hypothetical protein
MGALLLIIQTLLLTVGELLLTVGELLLIMRMLLLTIQTLFLTIRALFLKRRKLSLGMCFVAEVLLESGVLGSPTSGQSRLRCRCGGKGHLRQRRIYLA